MPHRVVTPVYTFNPNGIAVVVIFIFGLGIFIFHFLSMSSIGIGIAFFIFLSIYLYVRFSNSRKWRMLIWNEQKLIFSSEAIDFGESHYPVSKMETAAVYLDSFDGFEFRGAGDGRTLSTTRTADGDNNKISFRHNGQIEDFTFYLANYEQFAIFQAVINDWAAAGVNVVLKQTYDDDFIRTEMEYFSTHYNPFM